MRYFHGLIKPISLGRLLLLLSVLSMGIAFVLIFGLSGVMRDRAIHELAREDARKTSQLVFQSLYSAMRKGWNKQEINDSIARLNQSFPDLKIKVYRGEIVTRQFGEMSGERELIAQDGDLRRALDTSSDALLFPSDDTVRYLYPLQATQECLICHTQSHVGAVHGVIDITYPISNLKESFSAVLGTVLGYTLLIIGLAFLILYFKLRYSVVLPISNLVGIMRDITTDMDLSRRVISNMPLIELRQLENYFNVLLRTVHEYNVKLEELSTHDPLTGLYNRRKFEDCLRDEITRSTRHQRCFSVIMVDLDNFKYINDTFGHPIGDLVLKELSALLASGLRKEDVLVRMGGDEFAIMLPETKTANGIHVAHKLHKLLANKEFELPTGRIHCTASLSLVSFPDDGETQEEIYAAMDVALYKAKARGKNQVSTADRAEDRGMMAVFKTGDYVRAALSEDRIEAFLQPIVNLAGGTVMAFEVLVRIRDGKVAVPAGEFVDVAEKIGMAQELDREVLRKGLAHFALVNQKHPEACLFFNLFPRSFNDLEWVRGIPEMVRSANIPCERVVLEITEREALPNLSRVREVIEELRGTGIQIALDDFGSGFSSFLYLKYLQVDFVKIEGSFVQHIVDDPRDRIMVEHINDMAHQFGLKTIAEFVEDEATARMLSAIGVDCAQGYYFGKPSALA